MSAQNSTNQFADESGNALVEFVAWLALAALPLLVLGANVMRGEAYFAAAQAIARESARSASLGYSMDGSSIAQGFGVSSSDFVVSSDCISLSAACDLVRTRVTVPSMPAMPAVVAIFKVQAP